VKATAFHHDYPYRLRILHPEGAALRFERRGAFLHVDPTEPPEAGDTVILTASTPYRARGTVEALAAGRRLTVVAAPVVLDWLAGFGPIDARPAPVTLDGVAIDALSYTPPRTARPLGHFLRASVIGARPGPSLRRIAESTRFVTSDPQVYELRLEDGARLVHLDHALHRDADPAWIDQAIARFGGAEWLLVGVPWGDADAVVAQAPRFAARRVLVTELQKDERREAGLPTELVTPVRDRLLAAGVEAHVFATQASYRFE
jgi:hypothetical protein